LAQDSSARGIAIRIRNPSGMPINFGPDSSDRGNVNQWRVGLARDTTSIPMSAEYVSTGVITPGSVRALATFTMSYQ
jgi:type 1 fimbria pilin